MIPTFDISFDRDGDWNAWTEINLALIKSDFLMIPKIDGWGTIIPPTNPDKGEAHLLGAFPTGVWSSFGASNIAIALKDDYGHTWVELKKYNGFIVYRTSDNQLYRWVSTSGTWVAIS